MAEYTNIEKPFLEKLNQAHWQVIDQVQGVPGGWAISLWIVCWEEKKKSEPLLEVD